MKEDGAGVTQLIAAVTAGSVLIVFSAVSRAYDADVGPVQFAVRYISAASRARIGGDLYEVVARSAGVRLIVGDVQGKGLPAVKTAATVLGTFREVAYDAANLETIADRIEISLA